MIIVMSKKKFIPKKYRDWIEARKRFHLSHAHVQMARELGMNPRNFGKLADHKQERWKLPLPQFLEKLYLKRFGKRCPDEVKSIEQRIKDENRKQEEKRKRKAESKQSKQATEEAPLPVIQEESSHALENRSISSAFANRV